MVPKRAVFALFVVVSTTAHAQVTPPRNMSAIGPGVLKLFDPPSPSQTEAPVARFYLDKAPVTNGEFLAFVTAHDQWRRGNTPRIFADDHYLAHWAGPVALGPNASASAPVVRVSWFAAKAYCEAQGKRLPTENEWELAANANATQASPASDPERDRNILAWYARATTPAMPSVMQGRPNFWGVYDLHGLIWEWVFDFNSRIAASDGRRTDETFACGAGSLRAADKGDYAKFMRFAFRASLKGNYTTADLGFRCATSMSSGRSS